MAACIAVVSTADRQAAAVAPDRDDVSPRWARANQDAAAASAPPTCADRRLDIGHWRRRRLRGRPNVLLVLVDDAGFGQPSTFGGPIAAPAMTRVAEEGVRYNRFHVTALCSPTRAALLTGRNHHAVGFGSIGELSGPASRATRRSFRRTARRSRRCCR